MPWAFCLFCFNIAFGGQKLCTEHSSACRSAYSVVGKPNELIIVKSIFSQTAHRDPHAVFKIYVQTYLRTVIFFHVLNKLLGSAWKAQLLGKPLKAYQLINQLFPGCFFLKSYKNGGWMGGL